MTDKTNPAMPQGESWIDAIGNSYKRGALHRGLTAQEHAAIQLRVPNSGTPWLDDMIRQARVLDATKDFAVAMLNTDWWDSYGNLADKSVAIARALIL